MSIRVLIVDDHAVVRAGLAMLVAGVSFVVPVVWLCLVVIVLAGLRWGDPALRDLGEVAANRMRRTFCLASKIA